MTSARRPTRRWSHAGEEIIADKNQRFRVVAVVPFDGEDQSPFLGLLQVEAA